jgi:RNA polymerase sigma factor (sigma-70 family)
MERREEQGRMDPEGPTTRELYSRNEGLARAFASRVATRVTRVHQEDVLQEARLGLWEAARGFDPGRGCQFSTYAWIQMRRRVFRYLMAGPHLIRLPAHLRPTIAAIYERLEQAAAEGHTLDMEALAEQTGQPASELHAIMLALTPPASLDAPVVEDATLGEITAVSPVTRCPGEGLREIDEEALLTRLWVREAVEALPEEQRQVILLRFGFGDLEERSLREVAEQVGRSREWVRQTEKKALAALRAALRERW